MQYAAFVACCLIWGSTFVAQQLGMQHVGPFTYTGARFLLGAMIVAPLALLEYIRLLGRGVQFTMYDLLAWCGLGLLLFLGSRGTARIYLKFSLQAIVFINQASCPSMPDARSYRSRH